MAKKVEDLKHSPLEDYAAVAHLAGAVEALREEAARVAPRLRGRTVWMVNSTARGGGVAEMLPGLVGLLRELGVATEWLVIEAEPEFFALTKRVHNLVHGAQEAPLTAGDRALYDEVSRRNAAALGRMVARGDILVIHDPQPLGAGALLRRELDLAAVWRCHIGLDRDSEETRAAWEFLRPYTEPYDYAVFSAREYVPSFLSGRASTMYPSIDPLSHKNRELFLHLHVGVLCDAALAVAHWPLVTPPFEEPARRLQPDGSFRPAVEPEDIGLLARPIITQISRWDKLKGWRPLLEAFRALKLRPRPGLAQRAPRRVRRIEIARLVLAGPDPASIQDDPEALQVLEDLRARYMDLEPEIQRDVALLSLPMKSAKHNALMVNALQRATTIAVQNSISEGFGLTVTEAMWKHVPILGSARALGIRQQLRDGVDGRLAPDPEDVDGLAGLLEEMLADPAARHAWGRAGQRRVHDEFLVFGQLRAWLRLFEGMA